MTAFKRGAENPGKGRPKGSLNKRTAERQETFDRIVAKHGDPLEALAEMAFDPNHDLLVRKDCMKELVQYGYAKKKSVEISGPNGQPLEVRFQLIEQITGLIEKLHTK